MYTHSETEETRRFWPVLVSLNFWQISSTYSCPLVCPLFFFRKKDIQLDILWDERKFWAISKNGNMYLSVFAHFTETSKSLYQCCAKQVDFEANIGFEIEISQKYRYRMGIGYEIARKWTSILILFRNFELIDIGFDIGFELLHVGILHQLKANL